MESYNQQIEVDDVTLFFKREDLLHPYISGNKYRKLKYNLAQAQQEQHDTLLTFGGAFSNHILATAAAGADYGFKTIGIIRGEELASQIEDNPTLQQARDFGMVFEFVTRDEYRRKETPEFKAYLQTKYGCFYRLPEGGSNALAVQGCEEILTEEDAVFDYICCSVGTGGTLSGLINCSKSSQQVLGFSALKGDFLQEDIRKFAKHQHWELVTDYHFGGYGKVSEELIQFINCFYQKYRIPLDPIYTGKMVFGVFDFIRKGKFPKNSRILMIHTGGLQGIAGMNKKLKKKNQIEIIYE
ncbi:1-aminocyclopropane-1-carboxylate deaminase/D-cysteine desulfhydrase [Flavobacterium sp.]|uniref:1-aminocyclopropane-1-carboxylate deaminase/D-cysteine desulfhydrase n=1 Tax=Flavobacterium sp. TaxID=239 RepID=UPI002FDDCFDD